MRALALRVEECQERVVLETENLRQNQLMLKSQESKILKSSEQLAQKQAEFQAKGERLLFSNKPPSDSEISQSFAY